MCVCVCKSVCLYGIYLPQYTEERENVYESIIKREIVCELYVRKKKGVYVLCVLVFICDRQCMLVKELFRSRECKKVVSVCIVCVRVVCVCVVCVCVVCVCVVCVCVVRVRVVCVCVVCVCVVCVCVVCACVVCVCVVCVCVVCALCMCV